MSRNFESSFSRLASLTNWEGKKRPKGYRFDLSGIEGLCARLGSPEHRLRRVVQVGGSKGKGTVVSLLAGLADRIGWRTGAFLSPHVRDLSERILFAGRPCPLDDLAESVERVASVLAEGQTWFEAWTAVALLRFAEGDPDLAVFEVGLGGRLDATSVIPKDLCVLTQVELEHTRILGDSLASVAAEKAGILRPDTPCLTGAEGEALRVFEKRAAEVGCRLSVLNRDFGWRTLERSERGFEGRLRLEDGSEYRLRTDLRARCHCRSLALALEGLRRLRPEAPALLDQAGAWGRLSVLLPPARFQVLAEDPPFVVDGAHTDGSLAALASDLEENWPGRRFTMVFAVAGDKRWFEGLRRLSPLVDRFLVAPLAERSCEDPCRIASGLRGSGWKARAFPSIAAALEEAGRGREDGLGVLVAGSFYGAGEALEAFAESI